MKLYVWKDFAPDWSGGLAFAIAENEQQARELVIEAKGYDPDDWGWLEIHDLNKPVAAAVAGGS